MQLWIFSLEFFLIFNLCIYLFFRLHNLSGSKFTEELEGLLAKGVNGGCSEKVQVWHAGCVID